MGELVDGLLAFSRIGRSSMNPVMIDMRSMAVDVFTDLAGEEDMVGINFKAGKIPKTSGDKTMIRQVWINLISNALKYTSKKKYREIIIDANYDGDMVIYSVKDNGAGFEMEYVHKLFGVFQRLHSTRDFEGNGVGLAIVQRIIMRHGGKVWAEGEVDKGAVFYFSLPLYQE
jgi:light-regulated signal transduction histidine kinase (bacteriophytochrome)